jgi:hypothetical protein
VDAPVDGLGEDLGVEGCRLAGALAGALDSARGLALVGWQALAENLG